MLIKMLETRRGSEDGFVVDVYEKDSVREISDTLARHFIRQGWGREARWNEKPLAGASKELFDAFKPESIVNTKGFGNDVVSDAMEQFGKIFTPHNQD